MKYVCGADMGRIGNTFYAVDPMCVTDTVAEAVRENKKLHSSFGYTIYAVDGLPVKNVTRMHGMRGGSKTAGLRIVKIECYAFNHPAWGTK